VTTRHFAPSVLSIRRSGWDSCLHGSVRENSLLALLVVPIFVITDGFSRHSMNPTNAHALIHNLSPASGQAWLCWFQKSLRDADL
jgi:hypothetical protein